MIVPHRSCLALPLLLAVLVTVPGLAPAAFAKSPPRDELTRWYRAATDSSKADSAVVALRAILAAEPDSSDAPIVREYVAYALLYGGAPAEEILAATAEAVTALEAQPVEQVTTQVDMALGLIERNERLEDALGLARGAVAAAGRETRRARSAVEMRAIGLDAVGRVHVAAARHDSAAVAFAAAAECSPANPEYLFRLGQASERTGRDAAALTAYLRSAAVFASPDTSARAPLARLWAKRGGTKAALAAALDSARTASKRWVAFESRKHSGVAPAWELPDSNGKVHKLADYRGKVVVLNFWGSWCPPCRQELPHFQKLHQAWAPRGVQFMAVNWERPAETPAARVRKYSDYLAKNGFTFPTVLDHDRKAVVAYELEGFPTTFLIDPDGNFRFLNLGYVPGDEEVLEEQIRSLVEPRSAR